MLRVFTILQHTNSNVSSVRPSNYRNGFSNNRWVYKKGLFEAKLYYPSGVHWEGAVWRLPGLFPAKLYN